MVPQMVSSNMDENIQVQFMRLKTSSIGDNYGLPLCQESKNEVFSNTVCT